MHGRRYYPDAMLKANQDAFVVRKEVAGEPDTVFFGVFDGHGSSGTDCAQFARDKVPDANPNPNPSTKLKLSPILQGCPALAATAAPSKACSALCWRMSAQAGFDWCPWTQCHCGSFARESAVVQ